MRYPAQLGYRMPPEWEKHSRTFMEWPVQEAEWPEPFAEILPAFAALVNQIARLEPVTLIVRPDRVSEARRFCDPAIEILPLAHNDSWMRDNGPTLVKNARGEIAGIHWLFNGWGNKFPSDLDNQVAPRVLAHLGIPCFDAPLVMEGGSFHVDGAGTLLTTEECLLNPNRNPLLNKEAIEAYLKRFLNVTKIIWLKRGWAGDDTDGHIDNLAAFAAPGVVLTQVCSDATDPNYEISRMNLEILRNATDAAGRPFRIIAVAQPPACYYRNVRLTLSYLNFYFVNGGIILPVFGGAAREADHRAEEIFRQTFPERRIITVDGSVVARGGGNVHCLTQQIPAASGK